jgi:hypothetical protein
MAENQHEGRSRPVPHAVHTVGTEVLLGFPELVAKALEKIPYAVYPGTNLLKAQPIRFGATRLLGGIGKVLGFKLFGKIPIVGPLIDLFTSSEIAPEKDLVEQDRAMEAAAKRNRPQVEQGVQYKDGTVYFPKSKEWIFPPETLTLSKLEVPRSQSFDWSKNIIPPKNLQTTFRPDRPGQPGCGLEVTRSRPLTPPPGSLKWMAQGLH